MSQLSPDLFERRFDDLMEIGRARLRALAPDWTDHNAHDPGITLMELLAWNAEAQLYSLSRMRSDEQRAYGALLGLTQNTSQPSRGWIWPDYQDVNSPVNSFTRNMTLRRDTPIHVAELDQPIFHPTVDLHWTPGRVTRMVTRHADSRITDHTRTNAHGGKSFLPFGSQASHRDVLRIDFQCRDQGGILATQSSSLSQLRWAIGVQATPSPCNDRASHDDIPRALESSLSAFLLVNNQEYPLEVVSDDSFGMLKSGVILIDFSGVPVSPTEFTLELRPGRSHPRASRTLSIQPNVIPIIQGRQIDRELHIATGMPDWSFELNEPGIHFHGEDSFRMEILDASEVQTWTRKQSFANSGPDDRDFEFEPQTGRVTFGNGINGKVLPSQSQVMVSYGVSDGSDGNIARNRSWHVIGFPNAYGTNPEPVFGGTAAGDRKTMRRAARERARVDHALVTGSDLVAAAISLPLLDVARAWIEPLPFDAPRTGVTTLVVLQRRYGNVESNDIPETARWLRAIQRSLVTRVPLGIRLNVIAPKYVPFSMQAQLEPHAGEDPDSVLERVFGDLENRLALTTCDGAEPRKPGAGVTSGDVIAWMRNVEGVKRVVDLQLIDEDWNPLKENKVIVPRGGLPRWDRSQCNISLSRRVPGVTR